MLTATLYCPSRFSGASTNFAVSIQTRNSAAKNNVQRHPRISGCPTSEKQPVHYKLRNQIQILVENLRIFIRETSQCLPFTEITSEQPRGHDEMETDELTLFEELKSLRLSPCRFATELKDKKKKKHMI